MKINLLLDNPNDARNGYLNIDPVAAPNEKIGLVTGEIQDLSAFVDDAEAEEIVALDILEWFSSEDSDAILQGWLKKLAHRGKLTISTLDLYEVAKGLRDGQLSIEDANALLYGEQEKFWQFRKCAFSLSRLAEVLTNLGYKVTQKRIHDYRAFVTCERP